MAHANAVTTSRSIPAKDGGEAQDESDTGCTKQVRVRFRATHGLHMIYNNGPPATAPYRMNAEGRGSRPDPSVSGGRDPSCRFAQVTGPGQQSCIGPVPSASSVRRSRRLLSGRARRESDCAILVSHKTAPDAATYDVSPTGC